MKSSHFLHTIFSTHNFIHYFSLILSLSLFLTQARPIFAESELFNPKAEYQVHSVPIESSQEVIVITETQQSIEAAQKPLKTHAQMTSELSRQNGFLTDAFQYSKQLQASLKNGLNSISNDIKEIAKQVGQVSLGLLKKHGVTVYFYTGLSAITVILSVTAPMNFNLIKMTQALYKSGVDLEVRLGAGYTSLITSYILETSWSNTYTTQLKNFENTAHWEVGALESDVVIVGGAVLLAGLFVGGGLILSTAKTIMIPIIGFLPSSKKVLTYFLKETKDAFIETEKECNDRKDECKSLFDKATILLFNYLPDKMPDLGMDDVVINLKNTISKPTPTPKINP